MSTIGGISHKHLYRKNALISMVGVGSVTSCFVYKPQMLSFFILPDNKCLLYIYIYFVVG